MNKVVLISGMRQVGKTTLALAIADAVSARTLSSRLSTCTWHCGAHRRLMSQAG